MENNNDSEVRSCNACIHSTQKWGRYGRDPFCKASGQRNVWVSDVTRCEDFKAKESVI